MFIQQILDHQLAEASYFLASNGVAAVIDPVRDVTPYMELARQQGATIRYVFETHVHADFISGHHELAKLTGATIVFGTTASPDFQAHIARDHEVFQLGDGSVRILHTPGHSMESMCVLLQDEKGFPKALFTGDTLLLGAAGRPDLAQEIQASFSPEFLAGLQYDAIRRQLLPLPDEVMIYPGHIKGSYCAKTLDNLHHDTLGHQRRHHVALLPSTSREAYVEWATRDLPAAPPYFPINMLLNQQHHLQQLEDIIEASCKPIPAATFMQLKQMEDAVIIDSRKRFQFPQGFAESAIFLGLEENFSRWAGTIINDISRPMLLICNPGDEKEVIRRLAMIGYEQVLGYLDGEVEELPMHGGHLQTMAQTDAATMAPDNTILLDLRSFDEYKSAHIPGAHSFPLEHLHRNMRYLDKRQSYTLYCATGYRSMIAASCMLSKDFGHITHLKGGFEGWEKGKKAPSGRAPLGW